MAESSQMLDTCDTIVGSARHSTTWYQYGIMTNQQGCMRRGCIGGEVDKAGEKGESESTVIGQQRLGLYCKCDMHTINMGLNGPDWT